MRLARKLLPFALVAAAVVPAAGSAAPAPQVHVDIHDYFFAPGGAIAAPGSQLVLLNKADQGDHRIVAYWGATFATNVLKPGRGTIVTYPGGTVLYRCALHSTLEGGQQPPACEGMCGVLQSEPDYTPPQVKIATANDSRFTGPVSVAGSATDDYAVVQVFLTFTPIVQLPLVNGVKNTRARCHGCGQSSLTWRGTETSLQAGRYEVKAHAADAAGNTATSDPITVIVLAPRAPQL